MLVLSDEPRADVLVKISGAHGDGGTRAFTLHKDKTGQWVEKWVFDDARTSPHPAEVDLSHPDRISIVTRTDREYCLEAERRQGRLFTGNEASDLGRTPFTVLALDSADAKKTPLPLDDHERTYLIVRPDGVALLRRWETDPREHALQQLAWGFSLGWEVPWEGDPKANAMSRSSWAGMNLVTDEGLMSFARLWPVNGYWLGVEERDGECHLVWIEPDPFSSAGVPDT